MDKKLVKKNILDLKYTTYLQYRTTSIILLFTYFIGLGIALLTKQIPITDSKQFFLSGIATILVTAPLVVLMQNFKDHQKRILKEIENL